MENRKCAVWDRSTEHPFRESSHPRNEVPRAGGKQSPSGRVRLEPEKMETGDAKDRGSALGKEKGDGEKEGEKDALMGCNPWRGAKFTTSAVGSSP